MTVWYTLNNQSRISRTSYFGTIQTAKLEVRSLFHNKSCFFSYATNLIKRSRMHAVIIGKPDPEILALSLRWVSQGGTAIWLQPVDGQETEKNQNLGQDYAIPSHAIDLTEFEHLANHFDGADVVFNGFRLHDAISPRTDLFKTNSKCTANVFRACIENGVAALVHISTLAMPVLYAKKKKETLSPVVPPPPTGQIQDAFAESCASGEKMILEADNWEMVIEGAQGEEAPKFQTQVMTSIKRLRTCVLRLPLVWADPQAFTQRLQHIVPGKNKVTLPVTHSGNLWIISAQNAAAALMTCAEQLVEHNTAFTAQVLTATDPDTPLNIKELWSQHASPPIQARFTNANTALTNVLAQLRLYRLIGCWKPAINSADLALLAISDHLHEPKPEEKVTIQLGEDLLA